MTLQYTVWCVLYILMLEHCFHLGLPIISRDYIVLILGHPICKMPKKS